MLTEHQRESLNDCDFLYWLADRLIHVYGESPSVDFVRRLREIAEKRLLDT